MAKEVITRQAVRQVLSDYWRQYRIHPWYAGVGFFLPAIGSILIGFVPPLIVAHLINIFVAQGEILLGTVASYVALFGALWLLGEAFWRVGMHFMIRLETKAMNNLGKIAFRRLVERDYDFYTNNFVGSLTKKGAAFTRSFEVFTDTLVFNITRNLLGQIRNEVV